MYENSIQLLREYLIEELSSLAQTHTKEVKKILQDFDDEQLQLALNLVL